MMGFHHRRTRWRRHRRKLWWKLYRAFVVLGVISLLAGGLAFHLTGGADARYGLAEIAEPAARLMAERLPARTDARFPAALEALASRLNLDIALWRPDGRPVAMAARRPFPPPRPLRPGVSHVRGFALVTVLGDGTFVGLRPRAGEAQPLRFVLIFSVVGIVVALGCYPFARHITRRLEVLEEGARRWGAGDLAHRVPVFGDDEVALVTARFNEAATRIEALLVQQRQMLANASHELRSPLARIRMALELLDETSDAAERTRRLEEAKRDIVDLDALVEELLLSARAQPGVPRRPFERVDVRALAQEEAARVGARVHEGEPMAVDGDRPMLRHLLRNLLENAQRHGAGAPIEVKLEGRGTACVVAVEDGGPGVPEGEREAIFAPFYRLPGSARAEGQGLGLALVRQVARYHGGDARYVPRPGGGSRFEVELARAT